MDNTVAAVNASHDPASALILRIGHSINDVPAGQQRVRHRLQDQRRTGDQGQLIERGRDQAGFINSGRALK